MLSSRQIVSRHGRLRSLDVVCSSMDLAFADGANSMNPLTKLGKVNILKPPLPIIVAEESAKLHHDLAGELGPTDAKQD